MFFSSHEKIKMRVNLTQLDPILDPEGPTQDLRFDPILDLWLQPNPTPFSTPRAQPDLIEPKNGVKQIRSRLVALVDPSILNNISRFDNHSFINTISSHTNDILTCHIQYLSFQIPSVYLPHPKGKTIGHLWRPYLRLRLSLTAQYLPTSADLTATPSLTPSPVIPTTCPLLFKAVTMRRLCKGLAR